VLLALYLGAMAAIGLWQSSFARLTLGVVLSVAAGKLFVVGHDACHGSFTPSGPLNRALGRMALIVAYHLPSAWRFWHNVVHHTHTNDLARDFVWRPLSQLEYAATSPWRRCLERLYRHHSGGGLGIYYFIEILLPKMFAIPRADPSIGMRHPRTEALAFYLFHTAVIGWLTAGCSVVSGSWPTAVDVAVSLTCGFAGPLIYVCYALGFVVYFNHTHPDIRWHRDMVYGFVDHQVSTTLYLKFQGIAEFLVPSDIMSHVTHHLDTRIPGRHLPKAQEYLVSMSILRIRNEVWSWGFQTRVMRSCKLYDPERQMWSGFEGDTEKRMR
jgi:omega-6 fatty acid desaturase (delta-12 desaturase)